MAIVIEQVACLDDNYGFLLHDTDSGATATIDTPEVEPLNAALNKHGWKLTHILNTHHHFDHAGGNEALKAQWSCEVVGAASDIERIPGIDKQVVEGDEFRLGNTLVRVFEVPGHTSGHIAYHLPEESVVFVGDTLFALGCGRLFEGTPEQMWHSLSKLMALPDDTAVYCAHEYTQANAAFALSVESDNPALVERAEQIAAMRAQNIATVPTTIGLERATNPFVRVDSASLRANLNLVNADAVSVFAETRRRKDHF